MRIVCCASLLFLLTSPVRSASMEAIFNYDMYGVRLNQAIEEIRDSITARGFSARGWPEHEPVNWKFEKKANGNSEVYEVRTNRDGTVTSIRYQKTARDGNDQDIDMVAEFDKLSSMATGTTDSCNKYPRGGFQCVMHAGEGITRTSLTARTGRGMVYFSVSR